MKEEIKKYALKYGVLAGVAVCIFLAFKYILPLLYPFILAGVVSVFYYPLLRSLCKKIGIWEKPEKKWAVISAVVVFYVVAFLCVALISGYLFGQWESVMLNFPFYKAKVVCFVRQCCCQVDDFLHMPRGVIFTEIEGYVTTLWNKSSGTMLPKITSISVQMAGKAFQGILFAIITVIATFFMINDYDHFREEMLKNKVGIAVCKMICKGKDTVKAYVKAQGLIIILDGVLCTFAFWFIKQPYFLFMGPLVAFVDALPILGAGLILIPCTVYLLLMKQFGKAAVLALAYVGCLIIRQCIEPKMVGSEIGMKPLFTLISMYAGFKLFGFVGFILGPIGVLLAKEIWIALAKPQ